MNRKYRVLLCDDDVALVTLMAESLREHGWEVDTAADGVIADEAITRTHYDIVVIDIEMPRCSGYQFLQRVRPREPLLPIIILSAHTAQSEIQEGYRLGCDEYITKPFSMAILECHLKAFTRRIALAEQSTRTKYEIGDVLFDAQKQALGSVRLSSRESELLLLLCRNEGQVLDKHYILRSLWGKDDAFANRSLAVYIHRLRTLLPAGQIQSVRQRGYRFIK